MSFTKMMPTFAGNFVNIFIWKNCTFSNVVAWKFHSLFVPCLARRKRCRSLSLLHLFALITNQLMDNWVRRERAMNEAERNNKMPRCIPDLMLGGNWAQGGFAQPSLSLLQSGAPYHPRGFEDENLGSSPGWWAATVATVDRVSLIPIW